MSKNPKSIMAKNSSWTFKGNIAKKFGSHISKSVPYYQDGHKLIANLSDFFLKDNSICYDIGSSTGTMLNQIAYRHKAKKIIYYGIETVPEMIKEAKFPEENVEEVVDSTKGNRIKGGGNVYGFNRHHGDYDSSDDDV